LPSKNKPYPKKPKSHVKKHKDAIKHMENDRDGNK